MSVYTPKDLGSALGWLIEEAGEVQAAAGKSLRWGLLSTNPELSPAEQETNIAWLRRELIDLERAIGLLRRGLDCAENRGDFSFALPIGG